MADNTSDTTKNANGSSEPLAGRENTGSEEMAGGPPPVPETASEPTAVPTGSAEPAKQTVSGATEGRVLPPAPKTSQYEMPDDYANESPVDTIKQWVEAHPGLALLAAGGVGLVVGRLLMALTPDPEPPSLADRVEKRAKKLNKKARKGASHAYDDAKDNATEAAAASAAAVAAAAVVLKEAAEKWAEKAGHSAEKFADKASHVAEDGVEKAKDIADVLSDAAKVAVTGVVAKKADDWMKKIKS